MGYTWGIFRHFKPFDHATFFNHNKYVGQHFGTYDEKVLERGFPCLRSLEGTALPNGDPFKRMEKEAEEIHLLIIITNSLWNLKALTILT